MKNYAWLGFAALTLLAGCGGGSSSDDNTNVIVDQCSATGEKQQFLTYMRDNYFWEDQLPQSVDVDNYSDVYELLAALTVPEDRYSFILTDAEYQSRFVNAEFIGFGFASRLVSNSRVFINYVYADSPAANAGIKRSDELTHINGESVATLLAEGRYQSALGASEAGVSVELTWRTLDDQSFTDVLTKVTVETNTVLAIDTYQVDTKNVGYFVLNSFINRTGDDLNSAFNTFANVDELIIDVRYNGGGLTRYANQAATQAAGNNVIGEVFGDYIFNAKQQASNFTEQFQLYDGIEQLNLNRVYVLTTAASCSSSELIINALEPFVDVVVIGARTCGKPVGQVPELLCDKRTFVVNFEIVNALGEGRYFDGIAADCPAPDQLVGDWGDQNDPMLQATNYHIANNSCQPAAQSGTQSLESRLSKARLIEQWANEH